MVSGFEVGPASPGGTAAGAGDTALSWSGGSTILEDSVTEVGEADEVAIPEAAAIEVLVELEVVGAASTAEACGEFAAEADPSSARVAAVVGGRGTLVGASWTGSASSAVVDVSGSVVGDTEVEACDVVGFAVVATVVGGFVVGAAVVGAAVVGAAVVGGAVVATGAELPDSRAPMSVAPPAGRLAPR